MMCASLCGWGYICVLLCVDVKVIFGMCVYGDTYVARQIWGCLLAVWGAMCSQIRDLFNRVKSFLFVCVCGDDDFN